METWKDIEDYNGYYQVSSSGRIRSVDREILVNGRHGPYTKRFNGKIFPDMFTDTGYKIVVLYKNSVGRQFYVHRLVAKHFCCGWSEETNVVNHLDNNRTNNVYTNLEWTTKKGNSQHMVKQNRMNPNPPRGVDCGLSKLSEEDVKEIRKLCKEKRLTQYQIADLFGVYQSVVSSIHLRKTWKHI